jgi:hypothetical protein
MDDLRLCQVVCCDHRAKDRYSALQRPHVKTMQGRMSQNGLALPTPAESVPVGNRQRRRNPVNDYVFELD